MILILILILILIRPLYLNSAPEPYTLECSTPLGCSALPDRGDETHNLETLNPLLLSFRPPSTWDVTKGPSPESRAHSSATAGALPVSESDENAGLSKLERHTKRYTFPRQTDFPPRKADVNT